MNETQYCFSTDASQLGAPSGHVVPVREAWLAAGVVVMVSGDITSMPRLAHNPAAKRIRLDVQGNVEKLF
ncbi:MAG: formate--tetrahydrofolate ligase [Beijerinckiaceae bacterium]